MPTDLKKFSYFSRFFWADSLTIWLKVSLSNNHKVQGVLDIKVAALGALYSNANSPNASPGKYSFTNLSSVELGFFKS